MPTKRTAKKAEKKKETPAESIAGIAGVLVSGLFIITFIMQAFEIPSGSMENTVLVGDHVFVDRLSPEPPPRVIGPLLAYWEIRHGDIIVFLHPDPAQQGTYVVKRVIGIPGDRIHLRNGVVYRNGVALNEPYVMPREPGDHNDFRDEFPKYQPPAIPGVLSWWPMLKHEQTQGDDLVVPPDNYFGMGDNRTNSLDSRYWGFIPRENIVGRPMFIYWSFVTPPDQWQRTSMTERGKFLLHIIVHFFGETRWGRMFHIVH